MKFRQIKVLTLVTVLLLTLCLPQLAASAARVSNGIGVSAQELRSGEEFTVYIDVPASHSADTASIKVDFDSSAFEVMSWYTNNSSDSNYIGKLISGSMANATSGSLIIAASNPSESIDLSRGLALSAKMRVKNSAAKGSYRFTLTTGSFSYYDSNGGRYVEVWSPSVKTASVNIVQGSGTSFTGTNGVSVSAGEMKPGDRFNMYIGIPSGANADTASVQVDYDSSAFEVISWYSNSTTDSNYIGKTVSGGVANYGTGYLTVSASNSSRSIDLSSGIVLTAQMRVKTNASSGYHDIKLSQYSVSYYDSAYGRYTELWNPSVRSVSVKITASSTVTTLTSKVTTSKVTTSKFTTTTTRTETTTSVRTTATSPLTSEAIDPIDPDDPEEPDDTSISYETDVPSEPEETAVPIRQSRITLSAKLKNMPNSDVSIYTKYDFFRGNTVVTLSNSDEAERHAAKAAETLGYTNHEYYSFDISLHDEETGTAVRSIDGGHIEFSIPVPRNLSADLRYLAVYHVDGGIPELISSSVTNENGVNKLVFNADSFSPYMFVDTVNEKSAPSPAPAPAPVRDNNNNNNSGGGIINPNTGVVAAVAMPALMVGCACLSRKIKKHRKRTKREIE